jgi:Na+/H+ antiporter NhaA
MAFFLILDQEVDKKILLSESLSSVKFTNLTDPVLVCISGVLVPSVVTTTDLEISRDGENWSEVIEDIDFRIEFEPKIYVRPSETSSSGTIEVLTR